MAVCTYDNPDTTRRECWQDGKLVCSYASILYFLKEWPLPADAYFFGANVGDWKTGQFFGDKAAMNARQNG